MRPSCHLAPGVRPNELSKGLYPAPPQLAQSPCLDPRVSYTVIKHGLKMTGMPAWGGPHGDEQVWSLLAFVAKMPGMSPHQEHVRSPGANAAAAMAAHGSAVMPQAAPSAAVGGGRRPRRP